ncbi:MAG: DUF1292 domain-containing protein [Clostridia bacterium]|jgi:uncharacterized protein YrzB (UPF0473 family)
MAKKNEVKEEVKVEEDKAVPQKTLREQLFDTENDENIILQDENGNTIEFYQVAMIPHLLKNYVILKPAQKIEGIADDEAIVFLVKDIPTSGEVYLEVVQDLDLIDTVFGKFKDMLEETDEEEVNPKPQKTSAKKIVIEPKNKTATTKKATTKTKKPVNKNKKTV